MNIGLHTSLSLLCLVVLTSLRPAFSQPHSNILNQRIARQAHQLLEEQLAALPEHKSPASVFPLEELTRFLNTQLFQTELLKDRWYAGRMEQLKRQTGLHLSANYQHNEYGAFYENFENDVRFRAGLDFEFLENGLLERRSEMKRLRKDREIHQMEAQLNSRERDYSYLHNCLIYNFNKEKINLLQNRVPFLQEYIGILYELYFAHELAYDQIITQKSRLKEAEIMLASAQQFNEALEKEIGMENIAALDAGQLPIVQIDVEQLLDPGEMNQYQERVKRVKNERIDLSQRKRLEARLKAYVRYNYGSYLSADNERSFTSFGLSFSAPIQFNRKIADELASYEKAMVEEEFSEVWYIRVKELMVLYDEYQYKMKQYSNFLHSIFRIDEKLRVEQVLLDSPKDIHSPMKALVQIDNKQAVAYELLHLKQMLYLQILKIHLHSFQRHFTRCLEVVDFSGEEKKLLGVRFILFDESRDRNIDPEFLIKYLQKNEIGKVMLKGSGARLNQWAQIFHAEGFQVYCAEDNQKGIPATIQTSLSGNYRKMAYSGQLLVSQSAASNQLGSPIGSQIQLTTVPDRIFNNRNELERWIELENKTSDTRYFLFEDVRRLMELDKKNLGVE